MKKLQPPSPLEKGHLPLSQRTPLKIEILSIPPPPFRKFGWRVNPHPAERGGAHYDLPQ